eukprot:CFRG8218T1
MDEDGRASWPLELPGLHGNGGRSRSHNSDVLELSNDLAATRKGRTEPLGTITSCSSCEGNIGILTEDGVQFHQNIVADMRDAKRHKHKKTNSDPHTQSRTSERAEEEESPSKDVVNGLSRPTCRNGNARLYARTDTRGSKIQYFPFVTDNYFGRVSITAAHRLPVNDGAYIVLYSISTQLSTGEEALVTHRYSQFAAMHEAVYDFFRANHVQFVNNLPDLPPKSWWWSNQASKAFITNRRIELQMYLDRLMGVPRATECPELRKFLLDPF